MNKNPAYAGIGSRLTPVSILGAMTWTGMDLAYRNYILRSGGAAGADFAFELGCETAALHSHKEIYLPWKGYNESTSDLYTIPEEAFVIAEEFYHKNCWKGIRPAVKKLMARNTLQILGKNLDNPVEFVVCWTNDGCESQSTRTRKTGGTGQALALASSLDIPIVNMKNENWERKLNEIIGD